MQRIFLSPNLPPHNAHKLVLLRCLSEIHLPSMDVEKVSVTLP